MARVLYLHSLSDDLAADRASVYEVGIQAGSLLSFTRISALIRFVSVAGNSDLDLDYPTVVIVSDDVGTGTGTGLDGLKFSEVRLLLEEHYKHLNVLVYAESTLQMSQIRLDVSRYHALLKNRLVRMKTWAGLSQDQAELCPRLYTMPNALRAMLGTSQSKTEKLRDYVVMTNQNVAYFDLLNLKRPVQFYQTCVGSWGFIAHELSCDESIFCAFLMFKHAMGALPADTPLILENNALLGFLFAVRDSYRGGNAFHNFRHAVDVLQGTFYILIRLGALPNFHGYSVQIKGVNASVAPPRDCRMSPEQVLSLLLASVGHDVGHPGLTNDFLSKFHAPMASVFSSRAVLENFHSAWFQHVLQLHWPVFLNRPWLNLQTETILATDMASHFEYVAKMKHMRSVSDQTLVLMSLIIKCADISNVTRPLDISARWGVVLTREFNEIAQLTAHLTTGDGIHDILDPREEPYFPMTLETALEEIKTLPQNQLFFINNYAASMFKEVASLLPELSFMYEVLESNTRAWNSY